MKILCITPVKHLTGTYEYLQEFGEVDYRPESPREELCSLNMDKYDVLFCNPNKQNYLLDEEILRDFKGTILTASTGLNHIDVDYCDKNDIKILSHKDDHGELLKDLPSTAELSFGLMISILRQIPMAFDDVRRGNWSYDSHMGHQLQGKTVGIIGHGRLGSMMAKYCKAFGMNVIIHDPPNGQKNLKRLFKLSHIISLHVHANKDTRDMIDKNFLNQIKKHCYIINTSRGEIVNEKDIVDFLESGRLKGYATDVITDEYGNRDKSPILEGVRSGLNILVTPHVGGMTWEGQTKAYKWSIDKLYKLK